MVARWSACPHRLVRSGGGVLLLGSAVIMAAASIATHLAASAQVPGEVADHAEHVALPTVAGPLGAQKQAGWTSTTLAASRGRPACRWRRDPMA
jgi:hypothetical protein